ncbi:MAG: NAD-dependent epimerase/dehydratase family protein [Kiritimatiellae bacterium]|nr:NAD-dependent epimerase/dehydratase family protein [Kiritimatiellia bacterium]
MKAFITGGAGFLGINLIRYLKAKGVEKLVSYDIADFDYPDKDYVVAIKGDIRNVEDVRKAMEGCDIVIHCAAALPLYTKKEILTTDIDGTCNVLQVAMDLGIKRVIQISSTAVYGIPDHHPLYETDKLIGVGPYGIAKVGAEGVCESFRAKGLCVPIIRPKSFVGPERLGVFALLYDWALTGHNFPMIGSGNNRYQLLDVEDLCEAIWSCMTLPDEVVNDTFNVGAKDFETMKKDYQAVLDAAGYSKRIIGFPSRPVIWALRFLEFLHLSPLYKWVYETACEDSFVSIEKAEQKLGFKPKYSNKQALLRNFEWYKANLDSFKNQSGISHRVPWKQGILGLIKNLF